MHAEYLLQRRVCMCVSGCVCVCVCVHLHLWAAHPLLVLLWPQNFLNAGSFPEIQGFLQLRDSGRKLWKRFFCFLRRSGLYYSTKGTSKVRSRG